jgi:hypothetical protein
MSKRIFNVMFSSLGAVALSACGAEQPAPSDGKATPTRIYEFDAMFDPATGSITQLTGTQNSGLTQGNVVQNGMPGGPPNSVELITTNPRFDAACGFPSSFCGDVTVVNWYTVSVPNVVVQITEIVPLAGHLPLNSDPPHPGPPPLSNMFGLWNYGELGPNGGSATRTWVFQNDGTPFRIRGIVWGDFPGGGVPSNTRTFRETFVGGTPTDRTAELDAFQASLSGAVTYSSITYGATGVGSFTCAGATANAICQAIRGADFPSTCALGATQTFACGGNTWNIVQCGGFELNVNGSSACNCDGSDINVLRPNFAVACAGTVFAPNWGGFGTDPTCDNPNTREMFITCAE